MLQSTNPNADYNVIRAGENNTDRYASFTWSKVDSRLNINTWNKSYPIQLNKVLNVQPEQNGNVGIGVENPTAKLHIQGGTTYDTNAELHIGGSTGGITFHADLNNNYYNPITKQGDVGLVFSDGVKDTGALIIAPWSTDRSGLRITNEKIEIGSKVQIHDLPESPRSFPINAYREVMVDENGNLYRSPAISFSYKDNNSINQLMELVENQNDHIVDLVSRIEKLENINDDITNSIQVSLQNSIELETPYISQNIPNPSRDQAIIKYYIPETASDATVKFYGQGQIDLDLTKMSTGSYMYALIVDGELIDTKTMVIVK